MVLVCQVCQCHKKLSHNVAHYNHKRRQFRKDESLLSVTVPLSIESAQSIERLRIAAKLQSNTARPHITLVDGLRAPPPPALLQTLYQSLMASPTLVVRRAHVVPTRRKEFVLICFQAEAVDPTVRNSAQVLAKHPKCRLPQWPLHVTLGIIAKNMAKPIVDALAGYKGHLLRVDPVHMALLATHCHEEDTSVPLDVTAFTLPTIVPYARTSNVPV